MTNNTIPTAGTTQADRDALEAFVVGNRDLEHLETALAQFNLFEALGAVRQELRHSDFLGFLLNPAANHGLGDAFLKIFLKRVLRIADNPPVSPVDVDDWSDCNFLIVIWMVRTVQWGYTVGLRIHF